MVSIINSSIVKATNYVQTNDLLYRTALDITGFDLPLLCTSRNKDERRENLVNAFIGTIGGFLVVPLEALALNKLFASKYLDKNSSFFNLRWEHLDPGKEKDAIKHLEKIIEDKKMRLENPNWVDRMGFVKKGIHKSIRNVESAIKEIEKNPAVLKKVYKAKKYVLLPDLLLNSAIMLSIAPLKVFVTRHFAKKDRFTGTQDYLSDKDLNKLVKKENKDSIKKIIQAGLCLVPFTVAFLAHKSTKASIDKGLKPNKFIEKIRNKMDYTSGVYLTSGTLLFILTGKILNSLNWARDKYERAETMLKYSLIVPSFWFGDYIFNGNIAKAADKLLAKSGKFEKGTFIDSKKSGILGARSHEIKDVIKNANSKYGGKKANLAGKIATGIFVSGFLAHSLAMAGIFQLGNAITRKWVTKDLSKLKENEKK